MPEIKDDTKGEATNNAANEIESLSPIIKDDPWPLIPDKSIHNVSYVRHEKGRYSGGGEKLYVVFEIQDFGEHFGKRLFKAYNLYSPPKRSSDLFKDLERLYGKRVSKGMRLPPLTLFRGKVLTIKVRTVKKNYKQTEVPQYQWYSVVDQIIGIAAGSPGSTQ
jgi:hypothetical protein